MLDGGEIARFLHLATRSRLVSTRKDASVIPPWNEAVSALPKITSGKRSSHVFLLEAWCVPTKQPSKMRRNAMAASPSLKLVGHDEPDAGACSEPTLAPRTRDQRTTVRAKRSVERWGGDERWTSTKRARGGGGQPTRINQNDARSNANDQPPASLI